MTDAPKAFRREIDLGDGSGKQVYEADSNEELIDKIADAQANATRKIREQNHEIQDLKRRVLAQPEGGQADPDGPMPEFQARELSADELFALGQRLQNPATAGAALREALEAGLGASLEDVRKTLRLAQITPRQLRGKEAAEAFLMNHPEFVTNAANQKAIFEYMEHPDRRMALTVQNFEIAFGALSAAGLLQLRAPSVPSTNGDNAPGDGRAVDSAPPGNGNATPRFASTSVVTRGSGTPRAPAGPKMPTAEEIDRMGPAEHRKWLNHPTLGAAFRAHEEKIEEQRRQQAGARR